MEGALPSVVGGLVAVPVIAVPTSIGYGASFGGIAALLGMLNSCASGVSVVKDRKSTRLNSSHLGSSYAVFCLKKTTAASETAAAHRTTMILCAEQPDA